MSSVSGRQIRVTVPVEVFERITRTADALGVSVNELGARCVVSGVDDAIESRIEELEQMLATLKGEVARAADQPKEKPPPRSKTARDAVARFERAGEPAKEQPFQGLSDALAKEVASESANGAAAPPPQQGRAEKKAAIKKAELDTARRRRPGSA